MANLPMRLLLFLSSYFPLILIISVRMYTNDKHVWAFILGGLGIISLLAMWFYFRTIRSQNFREFKVQGTSRRDGEAMSYIVSYLLPFVALPSGNAGDSISLAIFLVMLCILYVNSGMIHINPTLNLVGWHVYEVTLSNGETCSVLTKRHLRKLKELKGVPIGEDIYLEVYNESKKQTS